MATSKNPLHRLFGIDIAAHGEQSVEAAEDVNLEVINLGLSRTGTTSMHVALDMLGLGPDLQAVKGFLSLYRDLNAGTAGSPKELAERMRRLTCGFRAAGDMLVAYLPKECILAYPKAKYILTVRDGGKDSWWASFDAAVGLHFRRDWSRRIFRTLIWPVGFIRRQDDVVQELGKKAIIDCETGLGPEWYTRHYELVEKAVPKEQLLKFSVSEGWEPLCEFLDVPVPDEPLPRINELNAMRRLYWGKQSYGAMIWVLILSTAGGSIYLASSPSKCVALAQRAMAWLTTIRAS